MVRIVERKPHPCSPEHEVVVFETRVRHELQIPKGATEEEVMELVDKYLKSYEDIYPETRKEESEESVSSVGSPSGSGE
ncbi:MAG: hypothetical protein QXJ59_10310 [Thermofilaceae archaeon]